MDEADPRAKLEPFQALICEWTIEMTHPMVEDTVIRGRATYEWLEGGRFLIQRAVNEHPDFPDSLCVIGVIESENDLSMQYFDLRGVHRAYAIGFDGRELTLRRDAPGVRPARQRKAQRRGLDSRRHLATEGGTVSRSRRRRAPPEKTESSARDAAIDTTLTAPGTQYGATQGNPKQRKPPGNAGFAAPGNPLQRLSDHS